MIHLNVPLFDPSGCCTCRIPGLSQVGLYHRAIVKLNTHFALVLALRHEERNPPQIGIRLRYFVPGCHCHWLASSLLVPISPKEELVTHQPVASFTGLL